MKIGQPADKTAISGGGPGGVSGTGAVRGGAAPSVKTAPGQPVVGDAEASAKVELSSTAATLNQKAVNAEFDTEKVQQIAQAISDNRYQVNAEKIADKLISNAQELLGKVAK